MNEEELQAMQQAMQDIDNEFNNVRTSGQNL